MSHSLVDLKPPVSFVRRQSLIKSSKSCRSLMHFGQVGEFNETPAMEVTAILVCRDLIRLAVDHCFRDVGKKSGIGFVGSVIRFPPVVWCSSQ